MHDSTQRFSSRVANYIKYRPGYPAAVVDLLAAECRLVPGSIVANVGSGTGILTELLLKQGSTVVGGEPNREMRKAGERLLQGYERFKSIAATAEATTLPDRGVDLITVGQAFHWFDKMAARREFERILKPGGFVALIWNERRTGASAFLADFEQLLLRYGTDYAAVTHKEVDNKILAPFFGPRGFGLRTFPQAQQFDWEGLRGRVLSASYVPEPGASGHEPLFKGLEAIFQKHQVNGTVSFDYDTNVYYGRLS